jgi:hypothetical protein
MASKSEFFQGLRLRPRPETQLMSAIRLRTCNPNSLLARPALLPSSFSLENCPIDNGGYSHMHSEASTDCSLSSSPSTRASSRAHHTALTARSTTLSNLTGQNSNIPYVSNTLDSDDSLKSQQLKNIRERITSRQLQNIVQIKRIFNAATPYAKSLPELNHGSYVSAATVAAHHALHSSNELALLEPLQPASSNGRSHHSSALQTKNEAKMRDKRVKFLKHLSKLEFSSLLFRRTYLRVSYLTNKISYAQILEYDSCCGTTNKAMIKQSLVKTQMFKCKTSRSRTRMLRSTEVVNGKVTEQWQRSDYTHMYCFSKRQRLRRFYQIQRAFGYQQRVLRLSYGRLQIVLPKLEECPCCKEKLNADQGHCCARRKARVTKTVSLLANRATGKPTAAIEGRLSTGAMHPRSTLAIEAADYSLGASLSSLPAASGSGFGQHQFTESTTTLMSIHQDKTEYYDYRPDQFDLCHLNSSIVTLHNDCDGDDISIIKVSTPLPVGHDQDNLTASMAEMRSRRKCGSTLLLDSSNFKDTSPLVVKRIAYDSELDQMKTNGKIDDSKPDTIQMRRIKPTQCTNRVQSKVITMAHENRLPLEKSIQIA